MEGQKKWLPTLKRVLPILRHAGPLGAPTYFIDHERKQPLPLVPPVEAISQHTIRAPTLADFSPSQSILQGRQKENIDGPEHKFQVNEQLLYEHDFHGKCYVSAHLQRLQHGVFGDSNIHGKAALHVTFVAVTFVFHPSISLSHRFRSAVIEITSRGENNNEPLRFLKFAPHLAYGRISTETLKWNFQLSATLGVTKGPVNLAINPSMSHSKDKVLGTMMKIQGSTRSQSISEHLKTRKIPDTKLVWSLEENMQQETGLPREFTFVFLVERPTKAEPAEKSRGNRHQHDQVNKPGGHSVEYTEKSKSPSHAATFTPIHIGIVVKPDISNIVDLPIVGSDQKLPFSIGFENILPVRGQFETLLEGQVGQRLPVEHTHDSSCTDNNHATNTYYNFAKMPGNFEDLVELPGNAVTTVVRKPIRQSQF